MLSTVTSAPNHHAPDPDDRGALRDLIQAALDNRKPRPWLLSDLARETGLAYNSLLAWMRPQGMRSLPRPENLDKVADALRLSRAEVRRAAQRAAGYVIEEAAAIEDPELRVFLATYQHLTPEARERIMRTVRRLIDDPDLFPRQDEPGE